MQIRFLVLCSLIYFTNISSAMEVLNINENKKIIFYHNTKTYSIKLKYNNVEKVVKLLNPIELKKIPNVLGIIDRIGSDYLVLVRVKQPTSSIGGQCGAGVEASLSVINIVSDVPSEIYTEEIASCLDNIELASSESKNNIKIGDYFSWNKGSILIDEKEQKITLHWGFNPKKEGIAKTIISISQSGEVRVIDSKS